MLTDNLSWEIERVISREYAIIEEELLKKIVADFWKGKDLTPEDWKIMKLSQLASYESNWKATLAKLEKKAYREIESEIENALRQSAHYDDFVIGKVLGDVADSTTSNAFKIRLDLAIKHAKESLNLTGTRAIFTAKDRFMAEVNSAYIRVLNGGTTLDEAMRSSVRSLAGDGMTVQYTTSTGKTINYSLDASIRRDIITSVNQTASEYSLDLAGEYGTDLVQVSAHFGARPSHAVWQGKVFSISGKTKGYALLSAATGYGTAGGLCGVNCRHTFFPYFAGFSKEIDDSEIPGLRENREQYENQQKQRAYEREIRRLKREIDAASITSDSRKSMLAGRLSSVRSEYILFLKDKGLTRFAERER